jgi:amino acid transporter
MADRFRRDEEVAPGTAAAGATTATDEDRTRGHDADRVDLPPRLPAREREARTGRVDRSTMAAVRARQREEFGGIAWGSAFFGWLTATGLGAILVGILSAVGAALALTSGDQTGASRETIGLAGGIALLVVLFVSYFAGGYVAGRMARFDGARQGVGVFAWAILVAIVLAVAGIIAGSEYNVLERLDLPRAPVDEGDVTTGGIIALAAGLLTSLVGAMLGGKLGERFHRKVDRAAVDGGRL